MARDDLFARLAKPVGPESLTLVGGTIGPERVEALVGWLHGMGLESWWSFGEWTNRMRLAEGLHGPGDDPVRFVAGRWFGKVGDLEVRRDGGWFRWRWVGAPGVRPPEPVATVEVDFFDGAGSGPAPLLRPVWGGRALLWDRADGRVATAETESTLSLLPEGSRLRLRYVAYYDRGVVAAVRYRRIEHLWSG
jgi:hypothetical protein